MSEPANHAQVIQAMSDGMYVVDRARTITLWNAGAERITGYGAQTAVGRSCGDGLLNHVDDSGQSMCGERCPLLDTMRDGEPRAARVYAHHRDGHLVPVYVTAGALRDESGQIVGAVETFRDDSTMKATEERLRTSERRLRATQRLAMTDALTGLGNRRLMDYRLGERLAAATRDERFAVVVIDLDNFKTINDVYGHSQGDRALAVVARSLRAVVTDNDDVIRFGGDEFVVITGPVSPEDVDALAARVRFAVNESWIDGNQSSVRVTASVGGALSCEDDSAETILRRADRAMLEAKRNGRGTVVSIQCPRQDSNLRPSD